MGVYRLFQNLFLSIRTNVLGSSSSPVWETVLYIVTGLSLSIVFCQKSFKCVISGSLINHFTMCSFFNRNIIICQNPFYGKILCKFNHSLHVLNLTKSPCVENVKCSIWIFLFNSLHKRQRYTFKMTSDCISSARGRKTRHAPRIMSNRRGLFVAFCTAMLIYFLWKPSAYCSLPNTSQT